MALMLFAAAFFRTRKSFSLNCGFVSPSSCPGCLLCLSWVVHVWCAWYIYVLCGYVIVWFYMYAHIWVTLEMHRQPDPDFLSVYVSGFFRCIRWVKTIHGTDQHWLTCLFAVKKDESSWTCIISRYIAPHSLPHTSGYFVSWLDDIVMHACYPSTQQSC